VFFNGKETKGFLFRKAKMHSADAAALPKFTFPSLCFTGKEGKQAFLKTILDRGQIKLRRRGEL
jgi:hypothetical protein